MRGVKGFNPEEDLRHERRTLTDDELARLVAAAESGPTLFGMPGPLRAMAYRLVAATGFRAAELWTLTPEAFRLDGPDPAVFLAASATKNRRPAEQPIPLALARDLAAWLADRPAGVPALPLHHETDKAIRTDLAAAGIPYETDEGVADFHSLRGYYVGALVKAGASISEVRALARHAKPETTLRHYARVSAHDKRGVVEALPLPTAPTPESLPQTAAATGTDGPTHKPTFALPLPYAGDGSVRNVSGTGGSAPTMGGKSGTPETLATEGAGRDFKASGAERGGFVPPVRPKV
jgi:hypothetical protein